MLPELKISVLKKWSIDTKKKKKTNKQTHKQTTIDKIYFISYRYRNPIPISLVKTKENIVFFVNTCKGSFPRYGSQEQQRCGQGVWTTRLSSTTYSVLAFHQWSFSILYTI